MISDFYRYNHLQKIEKQIEQSIIQLGVREEDFTTSVLKHATSLGTKVVNNVLESPMLNKRAIDNIIKYPWHGANYSDRIWNNKAELIASMKNELTNGIIQGKSIYQVANMMEERLNVGKSKTQRLVRTEYMHALNQGQIESYKAAGYTKLRWSATMDSRTSKMCRERNGKEYLIDQLPDIPAHPNCRCTFVPVIDDEFINKRSEMLAKAKAEIDGTMYNKDEEVVDLFGGELKDHKLSRDVAIEKLASEFNMSLEETSRTRLSEVALNQTYGVLKRFETLYNSLPQKIPKIRALPKSKAKNAIAWYSHSSHSPVEFGINGVFFKDNETLKKITEQSVDQGWFSKNKAPNHIMIHEFSHHIDFQLSKLFGSSFSNAVFKNMEINYGTKYRYDNISRSVGGYANSYYQKHRNHTESFAEMFAEAYGETPREIAEDFRKEFEKLVEEVIKNVDGT